MDRFKDECKLYLYIILNLSTDMYYNGNIFYENKHPIVYKKKYKLINSTGHMSKALYNLRICADCCYDAER